MIKCFVSMPGILKERNLAGLLEKALSEINKKTGKEYSTGFSTRDYFLNHPKLYSIDQAMRKFPPIVKNIYWDFAMRSCLIEIKKYSHILGLIPTPVNISKNSLTLGVANELAYAFMNQIPISVVEFNLENLIINETYPLTFFKEIFDRHGLEIPSGWKNKSKLIQQLSESETE